MEVILDMSDSKFAQLMVDNGVVASKSEWRRLFDHDAISYVGKQDDPELKFGLVFKAGKRRFFAI